KERTRRIITWGSIAAALVLAIVAAGAVKLFLQARESEQHAQSSATAALHSEQEARTAQKSAKDNESRVVQVQSIARHTGDLSSAPQRSLLLAVHATTLQPNDGS